MMKTCLSYIWIAVLMVLLYACNNDKKVERQFDYLASELTISTELKEDLYKDFKNTEHSFSYIEGQEPTDMEYAFYKQLLSDSRDKQVLRSLLATIDNLEVDCTDKLELLVSYVQSALAYDWEAYNADTKSTKYPYETLFLGKGICGDKSVLLAKCLLLMNYDCALFVYNKANHMAVGIKVPSSYGNYGTEYAYIETTSKSPIGVIPNKFINNIVLEDSPKIIKFKGGKEFGQFPKLLIKYKSLTQRYGKDVLYYSANKFNLNIELLACKMKVDSLKRIFNKYEGRTLPPKEYQRANKLKEELNTTVAYYNELVGEFNRI